MGERKKSPRRAKAQTKKPRVKRASKAMALALPLPEPALGGGPALNLARGPAYHNLALAPAPLLALPAVDSVMPYPAMSSMLPATVPVLTKRKRTVSCTLRSAAAAAITSYRNKKKSRGQKVTQSLVWLGSSPLEKVCVHYVAESG